MDLKRRNGLLVKRDGCREDDATLETEVLRSGANAEFWHSPSAQTAVLRTCFSCVFRATTPLLCSGTGAVDLKGHAARDRTSFQLEAESSAACASYRSLAAARKV